MQTNHRAASFNLRAFFVFFTASFFSLLQFFTQISGNLMVSALQNSFGLGDTKVGILNAAFFFSYMLVQIPAGILLDRFGLRKTLISAGVVFFMGTILFASAHTLTVAFIGRLIMGIGGGFGFVGMIFSITETFGSRYIPLMVGLGEFLGLFGCAIGQYFSPHFVQTVGWQSVIWTIAALIALNTFSMFFVFKKEERKNHDSIDFISHIFQSLRHIVKNRTVWAASFYCCGMFAILTIFTDIWGVPFLQHVDDLTYQSATQAMIWVIMGIALGAPLVGKLTHYFKEMKQLMSFCAIFALLFTLLIIVTKPVAWLLHIELFFMGVGCAAQLLSYSVAATAVEVKFKGTAIAFCNVFALLGAVLFQPIIGAFLTHFSQTGFSMVSAYKFALLVLPGIILLSLISSRFVHIRNN